MAGSKNHADVSATNIIKLTLEALQADDQQHFDEQVRHEKVLRQLAQRREKVKEKYLSYIMVDRHQNIIC
jgi:hypothetical protein